MSKIALSGNASGTGTFTIASPNSNTDRTLNLPDNSGTVLTTGSTFAGTGPAFSAYKNGGTQSFSGNVSTRVTFETKSFDTGGCFNNTGSTATLNGLSAPAWAFMPNIAGYYLVTANVELQAVAANYVIAQIQKNNANWMGGANFPSSASAGPNSSAAALVYLNGTTDYVTINIQASANAIVISNIEGVACKFQAFLARAA